ncbi:MAG: hypothetical protein JEZ07_11665 [Phycisphaerae bacterium]|nr:hypothetical protein [Phycisphaerae bacterium]
MTKNQDSRMILSFGWRGLYTDHKINNVIDCLAQVDARNVALDITAMGYDDEMLEVGELNERFERMIKIANKLIRRGVSVEIILPGLKSHVPSDPDYTKYIKKMYKKATAIRATRLWVDDRGMDLFGQLNRKDMLNFYKAISKIVHKEKPKTLLGLIAADHDHYSQYDVTAVEIAETLSGGKRVSMAFEGNFVSDRDRCGILNAALATGVNKALADKIELVPIMENYHASGYIKSAEATQMQSNINQIMGIHNMQLDCFDMAGTASEHENLFLQMHNSFLKQRLKLEDYFDVPANKLINEGVQIVIADDGTTDIVDCWAQMLWRMGIPVSFVPVSKVTSHSTMDWPYILVGRGPLLLKHEQLEIIFNAGVIMDCYTAELLQAEGYSEMLGATVGRPIKDVQDEILSYQGLAAPYFSFPTPWINVLEENDWRLIDPIHKNCEVITTLATKNCKSTTPGAVKFDNIEKNQRCIILPFTVNKHNCFPLMTIHRQRHTRDMLTWLVRGKLPCHIEKTPDIVPFVVRQPDNKKMIVALLNISFDWALDAKLNFGNLPIKIKSVKDLDEHGKLTREEFLQPQKYLDYQYIQLNNESAIPPMQMLILLIKG